jgi:hypothetical protein
LTNPAGLFLRSPAAVDKAAETGFYTPLMVSDPFCPRRGHFYEPFSFSTGTRAR